MQPRQNLDLTLTVTVHREVQQAAAGKCVCVGGEGVCVSKVLVEKQQSETVQYTKEERLLVGQSE